MKAGAASSEAAAEVSAATAGSAPPEEPGPPPSGIAGRASGIGLFAAAVAFLWPLAYSPALYSPVWGPKYAFALIVAGIGLPLLIRERTRAGIAAVIFLGIATLSTLLSDNPLLSLVGPWNWGTGLLFVASLVGAWALGRALTEVDRRLLEAALFTSLAVIAALALLQMTVNLSAFDQQLVYGRSTALQGNPVFLGGALTVGLFLATHRFARRGAVWGIALILFAAAMAVAQGRVSLVLAALAPLAVARFGGWRRAAFAVVFIASGWLLGVGATVGSSVEAAPGSRVTGDAGEAASAAVESYTARQGIGPRIETWWTSRHAVLDRPLLGSGPGRFWAATVPYRTLRSARHSFSIYYSDPHNFVVEYLTTTGVLGALALLAWLFLAARTAGGPFGAAALALLFVHLLQPQNALVTPLSSLALGASTRRPASQTPVPWWPVAVGGTLGLSAASVFLAGQLSLREAYLDFDVPAADRAFAVLPWPEVAERRAVVAASSLSEGRQPDWEVVRSYFREATRRDPADPRPWVRLGDFESARGDLAAAKAAYLRAQAIDPWSYYATVRLMRIATAARDTAASAYWTRRYEQLTSP